MGNCQAAEAATVVIQHPGGGSGKVERIYWSVSASEVMNANPGHYVAHVVASTPAENGTQVKQLKLLRPDDTLVIGQVYRLVTFEDVLKEFSAKKKGVKLGKLFKEKELKRSNSQSACHKSEANHHLVGGGGGSRGGVGRVHSGGGQWRPALGSISELEV